MTKEDEADRYRRICEARQQLEDLTVKFDEAGMFIVAAELRMVEKRVSDILSFLSITF